MEGGHAFGLDMLAPELVHKVALGGYLSLSEVGALSQTCRRMADILVWDMYGKDLHMALLGVVENVRAQRWRAARYAVGRRWCETEDVWKKVVEVVAGEEKCDWENKDDLTGWESVLLAALSLPCANVCLGAWDYMCDGRGCSTSLLHVAAKVGSERVVDWVLERGGDVEVKNELDEETPLMAACVAGHVNVAERLVVGGANVMARGAYDRTVLHAACQNGEVDVVRYLLALGVLDVDAEDDHGERPLDDACDNGHVEVVKVLVEDGGADVDVEGKNKYGPIYSACYGGSVEILRVLVDAGSGGEGRDGGVWVSGLAKAAEEGHVDLVRELMGIGVGVDAVVDAVGMEQTALCRASRGGQVDVVRVLVEEGGADVNKAGREGWTPLWFACEEGKEDVVWVLLEMGATIQERADDWGRTLVSLARDAGCDCRIVELLEPGAERRYRPPGAERRYRPPGAERSGAELGGSVLVDE